VVVHWPLQNRSPNAGELIEQRKIDLVINIPKNFQEIELTNDYYTEKGCGFRDSFIDKYSISKPAR
jgi:hypothetical protein